MIFLITKMSGITQRCEIILTSFSSNKLNSCFKFKLKINIKMNNHFNNLNLKQPLHLSLENEVKMTSKHRVISLTFVIK